MTASVMRISKSCLLFSSPLTPAVQQSAAATISNTSSHTTHTHTRPLSSSPRAQTEACRGTRATPRVRTEACKAPRAGSRASQDHNRLNERSRPRRSYATISSDSSSPSDFSHLQWPQAPHGHTHPTPYQILSLQESAPYTKHRFYELVKLYHPDRRGARDTNHTRDHVEQPSSTSRSLPSTHPCHNLARAQKLERYRLIVAAHAILSDPAKRAAYDRFGAGWTGHSDAAVVPGSSDPTHHHHHRPGPFSGWRGEQTHSSPHPDIWANATWEDWERFHARHRGGGGGDAAQAPTYIRNSYFVTLLLAFALMGSTLNLGRAESNGEKFLEARDAMHDRASKELRRVRQQSESRQKEERIQWFLRQREATMMGLGVEELVAERARRALPEQESCLGEVEKWERQRESEDDKERGAGAEKPD